MFDNVALNVVIGLVLVYLLYSLFITIISEMVTTWMGLRSRILRLEIEKMLNDGYFDEHGELKYRNVWHFVQRYFLKEFEDFKFSFAGKFYDQPSIKFLSSKAGETTTYFSQKKPSYFSEENFADTLIQLFKEKGSGASDIDKIAFCLKFNTHHIQPQSLKNINRLFSESGNDISLFKEKLKGWFKETNDRALGWYKRKLQLILFWLGFIVAVVFNVDTIQIARFLSKDKEARNQLANMAVTIAADSARYNDFLKTGNDSAHAKAMLDSGMAHISEDIEQANLILGLGWNFSALRQTDSVKVVNASCDSLKFTALLQTGSSILIYLNQKEDLSKKIKADQLRIDSLKKEMIGQTAVLNNYKEDTTFKSVLAEFKTGLNLNKHAFFKDSVRHAKRLDSLSKTSANIHSAIKSIDELTGRSFSEINSFNVDTGSTELKFYGKRPFTTTEKFFYVIGQVPKSGSRLIGFIITGLMLSLGAPFWFDLLRKLVALRGSGVKPEEKKEESIAGTGILKKEETKKVFDGDIVEYALTINRKFLEAVPGVIAVNNDYLVSNEGKKTPCIEVTVTKEFNKELIPPDYKITIDGREYIIPILIIEGEYAKLHLSFNVVKPELGIQNKVYENTDLGWGSVSGVVHNTKTNKKSILSCSHVLGGNNLNNILNGERSIIDVNNNVIGNLVFNLQSNVFDVAYADTTDEIAKRYKPIKNFAGVTRKDGEEETKVIMNGLVSGEREGVIINYRTQYPFFVNGESMMVVNLIKLTKRDGNRRIAISTEGDSGGLVIKKNGNIPVGIIIGGTNEYSFAISLEAIFDSLFIEPLNTNVV